MERVAVLGLDGLGYSYLSRIRGAAPGLAAAAERGAAYTLVAFPPVTYPSWTSIMTGVNPGKHGIFSFDYVDMATRTQRLYTAADLAAPRVHEILSLQGAPSVVVNPVPPYPIISARKATIISYGYGAPRPVAYPDSAHRYLGLLDLSGLASGLRGAPDPEYWVSYAESHLGFVEETIGRLEWRLYWLTLLVPDAYLHHNPALLGRGAQLESWEKRVWETVDKIYRVLGDAADAVLIVSDHGFALYRYAVSVNDILVSAGLARPGQGVREHWELGGRPVRGGRGDGARAWLGLVLRRVIRRLPRGIRRLVPARLRRLVPGASVDPASSQAFMSSHVSHGVYAVSPEAAAAAVAAVSAHPCIGFAAPRETVYRGPLVDRAPNIIIAPRYDNGCNLGSSALAGAETIEYSSPVADHHPYGVLVVEPAEAVPDPRGHRYLPNHVVAPLVLALLGVPAPHDSDSLRLLSRLGVEYRVADYAGKWRITRRLAAAGLQ